MLAAQSWHWIDPAAAAGPRRLRVLRSVSGGWPSCRTSFEPPTRGGRAVRLAWPDRGAPTTPRFAAAAPPAALETYQDGYAQGHAYSPRLAETGRSHALTAHVSVFSMVVRVSLATHPDSRTSDATASCELALLPTTV
ncbi:hypothetical protein GCM10020358_44640 [Amorphoplanes nipponensis]